MTLQLGRGSFSDTDLLVMAIVNRTPDSFFDKGASWADDAAMDRVHAVIAEGADIIDIGGVKAGPGEYVSPEEEARRTVPFIAAVRRAYPDIVISVDTWRHEVGRAACEAGADVLNDAWGGVDPRLAEVAAEFSAGIVCTHTGGAEPRTRPHRVAYDDVMQDILTRTTALADRACSLGVPREGIVIDPGPPVRSAGPWGRGPRDCHHLCGKRRSRGRISERRAVGPTRSGPETRCRPRVCDRNNRLGSPHPRRATLQGGCPDVIPATVRSPRSTRQSPTG